MKTPFATMCHFQPILEEEIATPMTYSAFERYLKLMLPSDNMFYAVHMKGWFQKVETRSVPRTENYRPLAEATGDQKIRHFKDIEGHLVGFYTPSFVPSVNVPGYHFTLSTAHFQRAAICCAVNRSIWIFGCRFFSAWNSLCLERSIT